MPKMLAEAPEVPVLAAHLWEHFNSLAYERVNTGFGISRLSASDIFGWCLINAISLELWELKAIKKIDAAYIEFVNSRQKEK
jgi:hypothetical protein